VQEEPWREGVNLVKAIVSGGVIQPLEPLPPDWHDGQELRVEKADENEMSVGQIDQDFAELALLCADSDPSDEEVVREALEQAHRDAKTHVRRQMGLG
jgi:hypothetical protein